MENKQEEKRRFPRLNIHAPVSYRVRGEAENASTVSDDISAGGLSFITNRFIPPETPIMMEINLFSRVLKPTVKTVWVSPIPHSYRNRIGVEFMEFSSPAEKNYLGDYISLQSGQL